MTEHDIPERLARFSALLAEADVWYIRWEDELSVSDGRSSVTIRADGTIETADIEEPLQPGSPITTAIALSREVWSPELDDEDEPDPDAVQTWDVPEPLTP